MKNKIYIILIILASSCKPKINNNIETLDKVFAMDNFKIEVYLYGCMGGESDFYNIEKKGISYIITSIRTKKKVLLKKDNIDSLKSYVKERLFSKDDHLIICTGGMKLTVGDYFNSVKFESNTCGDDWKKLKNILNLNEILADDWKE